MESRERGWGDRDLADAINKVAEEEPRRADDKLMPFGSAG